MAKLYFYYSAMNAGKSSHLIQSNYNYNEKGLKTIVYKPSVDNRSGIANVTSRTGIKCPCQEISKDFDFLIEDLKDISCILIDEAQFLTEKQVHSLCTIVDIQGIPVLCYGIRTDFCGSLFEGSMSLLALADNLIELKTICHCSKKATMNIRKNIDGSRVTTGSQVLIGFNYESVCRKHFMKIS